MVRLKFLLLISLFIFSAQWASAQSLPPGVGFEVQPKDPEAGEAISYSVSYDSTIDLETADIEQSPDFTFLGRSSQNSLYIVNGRQTSLSTIVFSLQPKQAGTFKLPVLVLRIAGEEYHSPERSITIAAPSKGTSTSRARLVQYVEQAEAYVGQQVTYNLKLDRADDIFDIQQPNVQLNQVWSEVTDDGRQSRSLRNVGSLTYSRAVYPNAAGTLEIPEQTIQARERVQDRSKRNRSPFGNDPFDMDLFFGAVPVKDVVLAAAPISLQVKELPAKPVDANFWGSSQPLVGDTLFSAECPQREVELGQAITCTFVIESLGNLRPIKKLPLSDSGDWQIYHDSVKDQDQLESNLLLMKRVFPVSLVPRRIGDLQIPAINLTYFNPDNATWEVANTAAMTIKVTGDPAAQISAPANQPAMPEQSEAPASPSLSPEPSATAPAELSRNTYSSSAYLFAIAAGISSLALLALLVAWFRRGQPARKLHKRFLAVQTPADLGLAFKQGLEEKLGLKLMNQRREELLLSLNNRIASADLRFAIQSLLIELEEVCYAGKECSPAHLHTLKQRALQLIKAL